MHDQAEDRCHRIGQHDAVTAWYLLAAQTIDETMLELIERKRAVVDAVTDGRAAGDEAVLDGVIKALRRQPARHLRAVSCRRARPPPASARAATSSSTTKPRRSAVSKRCPRQESNLEPSD